jgi:hypothetical protein
LKVRNGFVSNSSSSSFIVAFDYIPKNASEMAQILFGEEEGYFYYSLTGQYIERIQIAKKVFSDFIQSHHYVPLTPDEIKMVLRSGDVEPLNLGLLNSPLDIEEMEKQREERTEKITEEFLNKNSGMFIYSFTYSDNEGELEAMIEHSGVFSRLPHLVVNQH